MRILHLIYDDPDNPWIGGGGAIRTRELYGRLVDRGHECTVACGFYPGAHDRIIKGVHYRYLGFGSTLHASAIAYLISAPCFTLMNRARWDVVVEDFCLFLPLFAPLVALKRHVIQLQSFASNDLLRRYGFLSAFLRCCQRFYPRLYANAIFLTEDLAARWPGNRQRRYFVGMGIPEAYLEARTVTGDYLLYMGRLAEHPKGLDVLREACGILHAQGKDVRVVIAGKGPDRDSIRSRFASDTRIKQDLVSLMDFVTGSEKEQLLAGCRALVLPSRAEGEGLCITEAAALGKPVLASDILELTYVGREGLGINTRAADPHGLASATNRIFGDQELYDRISHRARAWAAERTWQKRATEIERAFLSILDSRPQVSLSRRSDHGGAKA